MLRLIIYHPKDRVPFKRIKKHCEALLKKYNRITILCNEDTLYDKYLDAHRIFRHGFLYRVFEPEWNKDPDAGFKNRCLMGRNADALIAFYNGNDSATKQMIAIADKLNLKFKVIDI